ncbi:DUF4829 domain-containing protein [Ammonifex thiophilus]|uniref:DUF4829 domain-containing protein n=1 Tax=Ammonifex thiophilus TaxID=444093 RepID=A0A3D8P488_9THEO|nr:DUF4829 domain-containing protein [Ammonifex thiophilus]RDV82491.1 DUF4829 domain-containing protein [Ammonifex thiophilus]
MAVRGGGLSLAMLGLGLLLMAGCGPPRAEEFSFPEDRECIVSLRLWKETPRGPQVILEVTDPVLLDYFLVQLEKAEPVSTPSFPSERYFISFRLNTDKGIRETGLFAYQTHSWDPQAPGYFGWDGRWVKLPPSFNGLLFDLWGYSHPSGAIEGADALFLRQYGWTPLYHINSGTVRLPRQFLHRAGEFPLPLYWAYANELSKDVGLDLTPYLGREVEVTLYKVKEPLPLFAEPRRWSGCAVLVKAEGRLVGAWLDAGPGYGFACSLKGRRLEEIAGKSFGDWVASFTDYNDPVELRLARMTPEEVIRTYWEAVNRGDYRLAHACETRKRLLGYLFMEMDKNWIYSVSLTQAASADWAQTVRSARVLSVKEVEGTTDRKKKEYMVEVDLRVRRADALQDGHRPLFFTMERENERSGWRIAGIGTGP